MLNVTLVGVNLSNSGGFRGFFVMVSRMCNSTKDVDTELTTLFASLSPFSLNRNNYSGT